MKKLNLVIYSLIFAIVSLTIYAFVNMQNDIKEELVVKDSLITLDINEEKRINASVTNNSNALINYVSANTTIATVDKLGNVKAISEGETTILVSYNSITLTCRVIVKNSDPVINDIVFPNEALLMRYGSNYRIAFTLDPLVTYENVTYISSNPNVVSVDSNGNLTALSKGNAKINVKVYNMSKEINVYVSESIIQNRYIEVPKTLEIGNDNITLKEGEESKINLNVDGDLVSYNISDINIVSINKDTIIALKEGKATIIVETINNLKKEIKVEVQKNIVKVNSITLTSSSSINLKVGETSQITYSIVPSNATNQEVVFDSFDKNVATVSSNGLLVAQGSGNTFISITTKDGEKQAFIAVNIEKPSQNGSESSSNGNGAYIGETGKSGVNKSCNSLDARDQTFNSCFTTSHNLYLVGIGGQDSTISMNVGEKKSITVRIPSECGTLQKFTRISPDGESGWSNYVSQGHSNMGSSTYTWTITAKKKGNVILSQTVQYDSKAPSGNCIGNVKSMIRLNVKIS